MKKIISSLSLLFLLVSCGTKSSESVLTTSKNTNPSPSTASEKEEPEPTVHLDEVENPAIHTEKQEAFLQVGANGMFSLGIYGNQEYSRPEAIHFSWAIANPSASNSYFLLRISENDNMENSWEYQIKDTEADIYNLKVGTKYYWNVSYIEGESTLTSQTDSFTTASETPRNLYIDGVTNVRDIGGWKIDEHTRVRQGLAYRTGRLNESSASSLNTEITEDGIRQMHDYLNIRSEIDLRLVSNNEVGHYTESAVGTDVNYYSCPMGYNGNLLENNKLMVRNVFNILSDKGNYPLIYHCNIGTDRTGLITYMLGGLLGVSQDDLFLDYEFSNLGKIGGTRNRNSLLSNYVSTINQTSGKNLSEKIANYLLGIGINQMQIDTIIDLFTEKY